MPIPLEGIQNSNRDLCSTQKEKWLKSGGVVNTAGINRVSQREDKGQLQC